MGIFLKQLAYLACSFFFILRTFFLYQKTYKQTTTILFEQSQSESIRFANTKQLTRAMYPTKNNINWWASFPSHAINIYVRVWYYKSTKYINLMQPALQTLNNLSFVSVIGRGPSNFFWKNCHIYTMGKTRHIHEPKNISLNCSGASTHFRLFFKSMPFNFKKAWENGNLNISWSWRNGGFFFGKSYIFHY